MGTTVSIIIGAIGVLGSIIYLINETIKVRREPEKREELYRLRKEEEKKLIEEFNALSLSIANNIKYRIRDEQFIDILINKEVLGGYRISKDKELLLDNGTFSLVADDFEVCQDIRIESYSYRDSFGGAAGIRDYTDYGDIYLKNSSKKVLIFNFNINSSFYINNKSQIEENFNKILNGFNKVFLDISNKFDFPEAKANKDEEKLIDELLNKTNQ
jgi:hypothetical protein